MVEIVNLGPGEEPPAGEKFLLVEPVHVSSDLHESPYNANSLRQMPSGYCSLGTLLKGRDQEAQGRLRRCRRFSPKFGYPLPDVSTC